MTGMEPSTSGTGFKIWGVDNVVYGPVELPTLVGWVKEERVTADTWIFCEKDSVWRKTPQVPELQMFFQPKSAAAPPPAVKAGVGVSDETATNFLKPGAL